MLSFFLAIKLCSRCFFLYYARYLNILTAEKVCFFRFFGLRQHTIKNFKINLAHNFFAVFLKTKDVCNPYICKEKPH